jgi:hypothetical protein
MHDHNGLKRATPGDDSYEAEFSGVASASMGSILARRGSCFAIASRKACVAASFEGKVPSSVSISGLARWTTTSFTLSTIVVPHLAVGRK